MDRHIGIYIHIPFCASKCEYCDFYSLAGSEGHMNRYLAALVAHIEESAPRLEPYYVDTVYFGGGTPSLFGARRLIRVFDALKSSCKVLVSAEVTVEVNPGSIDLHDLKLLRRAGFNRLSIGVQSANDSILKFIGRRHTFAQAERTVKAGTEAGFENISLDLIYGLPNQTREDFSDTLSRAAALKPQHFSCYGLKLEPSTPMYDLRNSPILPDDDTQADMYLYMVDALNRLGYRQYEISNFSQRGFESKHNMKYWRQQEYLGFGPGAHSYIGGLRFSYVRDLEAYMNGVLDGGEIVARKEEIPRFERSSEYLMLGLRTCQGISAEEYFSIYQSSFAPIDELMREFEKQGWARQSGDRWSFTPEGFLLSNRLIVEVLDAHSQQRVTIGNLFRGDHFSEKLPQAYEA